MSQTEMLIQYMQENGSITSSEAVYYLGITRLSARIYELSKRGIRFNKRMEKGKNRYGNETCYARYYLDEAV